MIVFGTHKWDKALELISMRLDPSFNGKWAFERGEANPDEDSAVVYFGGGHWRGSLKRETRPGFNNPWSAVRIFNPSEHWASWKVEAVELGVALLCGMEA